MNESYSIWEMGRTQDGRFSSMVPHACPMADSFLVGPLLIGVGAVGIAALQFANYYQSRKMYELDKARFEERRLRWLNDIVQQWVKEHRSSLDVRVDVTVAVARESEKLLWSLLETPLLDVPQTLLLKVKRLCEYFDRLSGFWSECLFRLASASRSEEGWYECYSVSVDDEVEAYRETYRETARSQGLFDNILGFLFGGPDYEKAELFPELLHIQVSALRLVRVCQLVNSFLSFQDPAWGTRLYLVPQDSGTVQLRFGPAFPRSETWYRPVQRLALRRGIIGGLRPVPYGRPVVRAERCDACGKCTEISPDHFGLSLFMKATKNHPSLRIWVNKAYVKNRPDYSCDVVQRVMRYCPNNAVSWQAAEEMGSPLLLA
jgi:ferredoxin